MRGVIRKAALWLCGGLVAAIVFGVVGEFFIELARERGFYKNPSERAGAVMSAFTAFVTSWGFLSVTLFVLGLTLGLWADNILRRREARPVIPTEAMSDIGQRCLSMSLALEARSQANPQGPIYVFPTTGEMISLLITLRKNGMMIFDTEMEYISRRALEVMIFYFNFIGNLLKDGHLEEARRAATASVLRLNTIFREESHEHPEPSDKPA